MKKTLLIAALTMMSASAFASKARMSSLGSAAHLIDTQTIFTQPADIHEGGDWVTFETGTTAQTFSTGDGTDMGLGAEGGFIKSNGDAKWGFYLGHKNAFQNFYRRTSFVTANNTAGVRTAGQFLTQENPIDLFYGAKAGDMKWAVSLSYSNSEDKGAAASADDKKQNAMGIRGGVRTDMWDAALSLGLGSTATGDGANDTRKMTGTTAYNLKGGYNMGSMYLYGALGGDGYKYEQTGAADPEKVTSSMMKIGVVETMKSEGTDFFYGVEYKTTQAKFEVSGADAGKNTKVMLPFILGVEHDANSWLVLRASVTQSVLLSSNKTESATATTAETKNAADTTVNVGAGLKFNKVSIDGAIEGLSGATTATGKLNANTLLAMASLTYKF